MGIETRKPIFDAIKAARAGKAFTQMEVGAIDNLLDALGVEREPARIACRLSADGIALIKRFEGLRLQAYPDPGTGGKPWTIGAGTTVYPDGRPVKAGDTITAEQAEEYLRHDLTRFEAAARKLFPVATQAQFDALVSWIYNIGEEAARTSTLRRKHNEGDHAGAQKEFPRWNKAGGRVMAGLVKRRAAEAALYGKETP